MRSRHSMPTFTVVGEFSEDLCCVICLDPWTDPVELLPCRHVFCRGCLRPAAGPRQCPTCRGAVHTLAEPHRILRNLADDVRVKCDACSWEGARSTRAAHAKECPAVDAMSRRELYLNAIAVDPAHAEAYRNLGLLLSGAETVTVPGVGAMSKRELYLKAIDLDPALATAYNGLASLMSGAETVTVPGVGAMSQRELYLKAIDLRRA